MAANAIIKFLEAARSLANQGMSKEAIMQFAKNEFGEITELFQRQIDNIFKRPASGIEKMLLLFLPLIILLLPRFFFFIFIIFWMG